MEERRGGNESGRTTSDKLPAAPAYPPLAVDSNVFLEVDSENEAHDDIEQDIENFRTERAIATRTSNHQRRADDDTNFRTERANATRTIYHQRRADDDTINSTRSLYDNDVVYYDIHGRRYCKDYYMPNDEDEQTRMQMLHAVHLYLLEGRLTTTPISQPTKILDVGTGCGDWAMAIGDEYPEAEVIGTDIAKIQPSAAPLKVYFEIDDAEHEGGWAYGSDEFDLVHFRTMMGAFTDWNHIYKEAYRALKPGGWIEVKDFDDHKAMLSFFPPGSKVEPWLSAVAEGSKKSGRPRGIKHLEHEMFTEVGFVDVSTEEHNIPMGVWPDDPEEKRIGKLFMIAQMCGIEALCLRVLTEQMGWDPDEVMRMVDTVSDEVRAVSIDAKRARGLGFLVRVVKARKPFPPGEQDHDGESISTMRNGGIVQGQGEPVNGV